MASDPTIFVGLPSATLSQMLSDWTNCLTAIAVGNQSYSIAGRQFSRANLAEVKETINQILYAQAYSSGQVVTTTYADFGA